jgi:peptidoglycan/LPS O-acetylase OafA/YrhL
LAVAGVDLFLVLSGFLIGRMLLSELRSRGTIDVARFYGRRALRIWPAYFLAVLFAWYWYRIVHSVDGKPMSPPRLTDMWPFVLQIQNYYDLHVHQKLNIGASMQTWTLAAIIHFYIVIPFLLLLLARMSRAAGERLAMLPWVVAAAFAGCLAMRWNAAPENGEAYDAWKHYFPTHLRIDEMLLGVLGAYWVVYTRPQLNRAMRYWPLILIASLAALLPVALRKEEGPRFLIIWGYTLAGIGCMGLILVGWWFSEGRADRSDVSLARARAPLPARWLAQVGVWSFSIYLWHQPAAQVLARKVRDTMFNRLTHMHYDPWRWRSQYLISAIIYFAIAISIGVVMYYLVEWPSLIVRERMLPSRRAGVKAIEVERGSAKGVAVRAAG